MLKVVFKACNQGQVCMFPVCNLQLFCIFAFRFKKTLIYEFDNKHKNTNIERAATV